MAAENDRAVEAAITRGMARQSVAREQLLRAGATHRGWKVAFTTTASRTAAGVERSAVGYLTDQTELESGATIDIGLWTRPMIEAELALFLTAPVEAHMADAEARAAIGAMAVAIEVVDVAIPLHEVEEVLAGDIFHRHFLLGPPSHELAGGGIEEVSVAAWLDGRLAASEEHPVTVIGEPPAVLLAVAAELETRGLALAPGDVVMLGSTIPLTAVTAGNRLRVGATGLGALELNFTA